MYSASQVIRTQSQAIEINRVLRNTYLLLSVTIGVAALTAFTWIQLELPRMNILVYLVGFLGLLFAVHKMANSVWGIVLTFALAAFIGAAAAPLVGFYLKTNPMIVVQALLLTGVTFVGLSMYTIVRRTDFSWLWQFLVVGLLVFAGVFILHFFVDMSPFQAVLSGFFVILACALILFQTSQIVLGGERNYVRATVSLFLSIYILFMNLLSLLSISDN
ncbi:MAG: Bax inhibitor-1 family protein [Gammaproteobacteria bacterium]|nr:Bax inhibitor-1 family protein [Gammaproteobacteria bacterium]